MKPPLSAASLILIVLLASCERQQPTAANPEELGLKVGQQVMIRDVVHPPFVISYSSKGRPAESFVATHTVLVIDPEQQELVLGALGTRDKMTIPWSAIGSVSDTISTLKPDLSGQDLLSTKPQ